MGEFHSECIMQKKLLLCFICAIYVLPVFANDDYHHYPGVFVGTTHNNNTFFTTVGLEYEYRTSSSTGVGLAYEHISDYHDGAGADLLALQLFYHPNTHIKLGLGFGQERIGGHHARNDTFYRLSAAYEYHVEPFEIEPTVDFDVMNGDTSVAIGIAIVMPF